MAATLEQDHSAVFSGVDWDFYWTTREKVDSKRQITFDGERMEIMSSPISLRHDKDKTLFARLFELWAFLEDRDIDGVGSVTLAAESLNRGCEADEAYYVEAQLPPNDPRDIDLAIHEPPDLIVEVDLTSRSVSKEPVYCAMGVAELWRWENETLTIRRLVDGQFQTIQRSMLLPDFDVAAVPQMLRIGRESGQRAMLRAWKKHLGK